MSIVRLVCMFCLLAVLVPSAAWADGPSNKWRIAVNHAARVGGEIELAFTPKDGPATSLVVRIPAGTHENHAAYLIRDAIRARFGKSVYKTELDDGEDVLIKVRRGTPDFDLAVVRNTAEGLSLHLHRE